MDSLGSDFWVLPMDNSGAALNKLFLVIPQNDSYLYEKANWSIEFGFENGLPKSHN